MSLSLLDSLALLQVHLKLLIFNVHQVIHFLCLEHRFSLSFNTSQQFWVFGHQPRYLNHWRTQQLFFPPGAPLLVSLTATPDRCTPLCLLLHQHLFWHPFKIHPKKLHSVGMFAHLCSPKGPKVKRLVSAAAHLSCCFCVSRPCWMQINKIQNKMHDCQIPVLSNLCHAEEARTSVSLEFSSHIKWVTKRQTLANVFIATYSCLL